MNFLWVYSSEAHPEEYPFSAGNESADLGWEHPYSITTSMEQRAERGRWLQSDLEPDGELPVMVDFINSPGGEDNNAIRAAYRGDGFYSGFIIDCDGRVLQANSWAWYGPGRDWWGLPLVPIAKLHATLDAYLENPPDCYRR